MTYTSRHFFILVFVWLDCDAVGLATGLPGTSAVGWWIWNLLLIAAAENDARFVCENKPLWVRHRRLAAWNWRSRFAGLGVPLRLHICEGWNIADPDKKPRLLNFWIRDLSIFARRTSAPDFKQVHSTCETSKVSIILQKFSTAV